MSVQESPRSGEAARADHRPARRGSPRSRRLRPAVVLAACALVFLAIAFLGTGFTYVPLIPGGERRADAAAKGGLTEEIEKAHEGLCRRMGKAAPRGRYIVIDQTHNRLYLREKDRTLLSAVCSCGSGIVLSHGTKQWVFDTPPGIFRINQMIEDPVWRKPDWAFIEEGKPIPRDPSERFEYDMMGEYALGFGNGYFIHGTLYERLLGRSVTHGCIRLGRQDLRELYRKVHAGTPIYIF
ncbi:MAG: L,D-transpeptidase [Candidatus Eisenbacteria bacterium]